jgi:hypothetical protein
LAEAEWMDILQQKGKKKISRWIAIANFINTACFVIKVCIISLRPISLDIEELDIGDY